MYAHRELKKLLVRICQLLAQKDYVSAMDGNVSARLPDGTFLTTPTMIHKAFIAEDDLIVVDSSGRKLAGPAERQPTSELFMHLACYEARADVKAVVHAHPPTAIAFTIAGESLARCVLPEVVLTLGQIPTAPYKTTGTRDLAALVGQLMKRYDALLMDRHGVITVGKDLIDAFGKLEKVEHTAMITHRARALGKVQELDCQEVEKLRALGKKYTGTGELPPACEGCGGCPSRQPWQAQPSFEMGRISQQPSLGTTLPGSSSGALSSEGLQSLVLDEVLRALKARSSG